MKKGPKKGSIAELVGRCPISVVIPACGRDVALRRAVCSALDQTLAPSEIIVVDDGSPQPIARMSLPEDRRVKLMRLDVNAGPAAARNAGIMAANSDWIAFLDSDDIWYPDKLARQWVLAETAEDGARAAFVTGWAKICKGTVSSQVVPRGADGLRDFALGCWFCPGSTALIHRKAFDLVGLFDAELRRLEDYDWYLQFGEQGGRLIVTQAALVGITWDPGKPTPFLDSAVRALNARYLDAASSEYLADHEARRCIRAYLCLVRASVLWHSGQKLTALPLLLRSLVANPRLSLQNDRVHAALPEQQESLPRHESEARHLLA